MHLKDALTVQAVGHSDQREDRSKNHAAQRMTTSTRFLYRIGNVKNESKTLSSVRGISPRLKIQKCYVNVRWNIPMIVTLLIHLGITARATRGQDYEAEFRCHVTISKAANFYGVIPEEGPDYYSENENSELWEDLDVDCQFALRDDKASKSPLRRNVTKLTFQVPESGRVIQLGNHNFIDWSKLSIKEVISAEDVDAVAAPTAAASAAVPHSATEVTFRTHHHRFGRYEFKMMIGPELTKSPRCRTAQTSTNSGRLPGSHRLS